MNPQAVSPVGDPSLLPLLLSQHGTKARPWFHFDKHGAFHDSPPPAPSPPALPHQLADAGPPKIRRARCPASANPALTFRASLKDPLREPMKALKLKMRRTRGKGAHAEKEHVRVLIAGLSRRDEHRALRERVQVATLGSQRTSSMGQYTMYCASKGTRPILPITCDMAKGFLTWSVVKHGAVSSHTLRQVLSHLRMAATAMDQWRVSKEGELELGTLITMLQQTIPSMPQRTKGVPVAAVRTACESLRRIGTLQALQTRALLAGSMGALARGKEVGSEEGMQWGDLVLDHRGMAFEAHLCKTGKSSLQARVRVCPHMPKGFEPVCPTRCLLEFKEAWLGAGGSASSDDLVWRRITKTGLPSELPLSVNAATNLIRGALLTEQLEGAKVDAHWARHTGRHLLQFELGFGSEGADLMGDWKPTVEGGKRKSTGETHYAHLTVDQAWTQAMKLAPYGFTTRCCQRK